MSDNTSLGSSPIGGSSKKSERSTQKNTDESDSRRSLGSSPVDIKPDNSPKYDFIPDLGVSSKSEQSSSQQSSANKGTSNSGDGSDPSKKRIVSYNLEADLIARVKTAAKRNEMYYSSLVSKALKQWLVENK